MNLDVKYKQKWWCSRENPTSCKLCNMDDILCKTSGCYKYYCYLYDKLKEESELFD